MQRFTKFAVAAVVALGLASFPTIVGAKGQKKAGGGSHSMTGCLQKGDEPNTFKLTNIEGTGPKMVELVETPSSVDLAAHVGHKVTITGASVAAREAAKAEGTSGKKEVKEERREHHMRAASVSMVSATCS